MNNRKAHQEEILRQQRDIVDDAGNELAAAYANIQPAYSTNGPIFWAKAKENWHGQAGNGSYAVCYPCSHEDGSNTNTSVTFNVRLLRGTNTDPNVVTNQVIGYAKAVNGANVAVTGYLDDAIGTIKMWSKNTGGAPSGWSECDSTGSGNVRGLKGRYPIAKDSSDTDFDVVGETGGSKWHSHGMSKHGGSPAAGEIEVIEGEYSSIALSVDLTEESTIWDDLPPYCVVRFIERINNSL